MTPIYLNPTRHAQRGAVLIMALVLLLVIFRRERPVP